MKNLMLSIVASVLAVQISVAQDYLAFDAEKVREEREEKATRISKMTAAELATPFELNVEQIKGNATAFLNINMGHSGKAEIALFDRHGAAQGIVFDGQLNAGKHSVPVIFDGKQNQPMIAVLTVNGKVRQMKLVNVQ